MTGMEIVGPSVQRISTTFPSFLFALGILVVGYVIAKIAAGLVSRALGRTRLDARTAEALGLTSPARPPRCARWWRGSPSGSSCSSC